MGTQLSGKIKSTASNSLFIDTRQDLDFTLAANGMLQVVLIFIQSEIGTGVLAISQEFSEVKSFATELCGGSIVKMKAISSVTHGLEIIIFSPLWLVNKSGKRLSFSNSSKHKSKSNILICDNC